MNNSVCLATGELFGLVFFLRSFLVYVERGFVIQNILILYHLYNLFSMVIIGYICLNNED